MSDPMRDATFGDALDAANITQLRLTADEISHEQNDILQEEDEAAFALMAYYLHKAKASYKRRRLESMCGGVTRAHQKARARTDAMAEGTAGGPFDTLSNEFGLAGHEE